MYKTDYFEISHLIDDYKYFQRLKATFKSIVQQERNFMTHLLTHS